METILKLCDVFWSRLHHRFEKQYIEHRSIIIKKKKKTLSNKIDLKVQTDQIQY